MKALREIVLVFLAAAAIGGCASTNSASQAASDDSAATPTRTIYVPHPGSQHIGPDEPLDDTSPP